MTRLDDDYANAPFIPDGASYPERWSTAAEAFRVALGPRSRTGLPYGPSPRQTYDLFDPDGTSSGTLIFVHGGYWRALEPARWSHLAQGALAHGWSVAMPGYDLCPTVRIATITRQIAEAVTCIAESREGPIALTGHSAGGHLVARMMAPGVLPRALQDRITHLMPISPLSDLTPLIETAMNADFRMDKDMARAESPVHQPVPNCPVSVRVGADERPGFLWQARILAEAWDAPLEVCAGKHHFDIIDDLADPDSDMLRRLLAT